MYVVRNSVTEQICRQLSKKKLHTRYFSCLMLTAFDPEEEILSKVHHFIKHNHKSARKSGMI
jgi:hypothetical protein